MGVITGIQWCDSTQNLQMGCEGCELIKGADIASGERKPSCYAGTLTDRYAGRKGWPEAFTKPSIFPERLGPMLNWPDITGKDRQDKPWLNGLPRIIFLNDMGDTFTRGLPEEWFAEYMPKLGQSKHQFLVLTKWPARFAKFSRKYKLPPNVWPGTTITSSKTLFRANDLLSIEGGGPHFVSFEPMWDPVFNGKWKDVLMLKNIEWAIFGGESGARAKKFELDWLAQALDYCRLWRIPAFVKQMGSNPYWMGEKIKMQDFHGGEMGEWPERFRVREMPITFQPKLF